jgi:periplasmic protein TonB
MIAGYQRKRQSFVVSGGIDYIQQPKRPGFCTRNGVRRIGGAVSSPILISSAQPEYSEEARKAKTSGSVLVNLIVDKDGMPENVHVLRGLGMGLDEKAIEAVQQYRFTPSMEGGKPVPVECNVEVIFQIF